MGDVSQHFDRREFSCSCGCNFNTVDTELLDVLEDVRNYFGVPVKITSACRCSTHNFNIKGSKFSKHLLGQAADIQVLKVPTESVQEYLNNRYPDKYGVGSYDSFTHVDIRVNTVRWNKRKG